MPSTAPAEAAGSRQAMYDAAQAAYDKQDWSAAAAGFAPLLPASGVLSPSEAVIASRLGDALVSLQRFDEAKLWLDRATANAAALDPDARLLAFLKLGDADRYLFDYRGAAVAYDHVIADAGRAKDAIATRAARIGLAYAAMTIEPDHVAAELDTELRDDALVKALSKSELADIEDLRARAAINAGDAKTAAHWIERALDHSGGLTPTVSFAQATIRADAAIIARLRHDDEDARRDLTYTGAGHMASMDWIGHFAGQLPACGLDIRPDDSVVVQFFLSDDGHVEGALPIYASRPGTVGLVFAEAVDRWRWSAAEVGKIDSFWRHTVRFELRCVSRPSARSLAKPFVDAAADWLTSYRTTQNAQFSAFSAAVAKARADGDIPPAMSHDPAPGEASQATLQATLDKAHAPAAVQALLVMQIVGARQMHADTIIGAARRRVETMSAIVPDFRHRFPAEPATAWLMLEWALALEDAHDFSSAAPLLQQIADMPRSVLGADDPIRSVGALHLAIARRRTGADAAAAPTAVTPAEAAECSLFDTHPIAQSVSIADTAFPQEAMRWNFEGYVQEDYDIGADGHVSNIRTVLAYPPFVFGPATEQAVRSFRYIAPSIDGKAVGCASKIQSVTFKLPG